MIFALSTLFLFVLIVLRWSWLNVLRPKCRPFIGCFLFDQLCLFEKNSLKNLPFLLIWSTVWSMRWSEIKDPGLIISHPVSFRFSIWSKSWFSSCSEFSVRLYPLSFVPVDIGSFDLSDRYQTSSDWWKEIFCSNENAPLSSCTWTQIFVSLPGYQLFGTPVVLQSSGVICPSFLLFFFVSLLYKIRCNLSTTFPIIFKLSEFSDFIAQLRE